MKDFRYFSRHTFRAILEPLFQPQAHFPKFFFPSEKLRYQHGGILMSRHTGPKGMGNLWLVFDPDTLVLDDLHLYTYATGKAPRFQMDRRPAPRSQTTASSAPRSEPGVRARPVWSIPSREIYLNRRSQSQRSTALAK